MRIIAGEKRGFPLVAPGGNQTRPTLGRVRESLFAILGSDVIDAVTCDLFAGAGALGLEALSRGATSCTFVEQSAQAQAALRQNIDKLGYSEQSTVVAEDALRWLGRMVFASEPVVIFADPPYNKGQALETLRIAAGNSSLVAETILILQCESRESLPEETGSFQRYRIQKYGPTSVHFFSSKAVLAQASLLDPE